jgi:hypothetical protein
MNSVFALHMAPDRLSAGCSGPPAPLTNYCPMPGRFIEMNPGYAPVIDLGNAGNWS